MRLVLFALNLLVLVTVVVADNSTTTRPGSYLVGQKVAFRSVGAVSRPRRDKYAGPERNGIGAPSTRKGRDVSFMDRVESELKETSNSLNSRGSQTMRRGRDVSYLDRSPRPVAMTMHPEDGFPGSEMSRRKREIGLEKPKVNKFQP